MFSINQDKQKLKIIQSILLQASIESNEVQLTQSLVTSTKSRKDEKTVILVIDFANVEKIGVMSLEFFFEVKSVGYYTLTKVTYKTTNAELRTKRDISFPFRFSYHCSPRTIFTNGNIELTITDMQVQVDSKEVPTSFSDAYDCVGFTSIPIWTGIFVTLILGLIMVWALTMIMDIRTMDRFDDPKGKTITISSAD